MVVHPRRWSWLVGVAALCGGVACGDDEEPPDPPGPTDTGTETTGEPTGPGTTGTTSDTTTNGTGTGGGGGGGECSDDSFCDPDKKCFDAPDGECACPPGFVLCGTQCIDIASDESHCGQCNRPCGAMTACIQGVCGVAPPPGPVFEPATLVSGGSPSLECSSANELKPERPVNFLASGVPYFAGVQVDEVVAAASQGFYSFADQTFDWTDTQTVVPVDNVDVIGDPWTTTHGGTGLEYVSFFAQRPDGAGFCVAVAETAADGLATNNWLVPARCVEPEAANRTDGPIIYADLGANAIYVAYTEVGLIRSFQLLRFAPCTGPALGDPACPLQWKISPPDLTPLDRHPNVVVNPCTHHAIAVARASGGISYAIYDTNGDLVAADLADDVDHAPNSNCAGTPCGQAAIKPGEICRCGGVDGDCGEQPGCWDLAGRVHAATYFDPDPDSRRCFLNLAYDFSEVALDGEIYMKTRMRTFDITDESNITQKISLDSDSPSAPHNDFNGIVAVDRFTGALGLFFYRQEPDPLDPLGRGDPCTTTFQGIVSDDGNLFGAAKQLSGEFPSMRFDFTDGLGHYIEAARFTEPGLLLPSWSQPIAIQDTNTSCVSCQGADFSMATMGTRVRP